MTIPETIKDDRKVKLSVCQICNGWVRVAVLDYFNTNTKARNEFMKEVSKYNLAVKEIPFQEWKENNIEHCKCK